MTSTLSLIGREKELFSNDITNHESQLAEIVSSSRFLVLGGAASIGQAVTKEIFKRNPAKLHVVDISENNLVELVRDIRSSFGYIPGDFRTFALDIGSVEYDAFFKADGGYDYILNLSALKHVRSEKDPYTLMRMVDVNVFNTDKTLQQAVDAGARKYFCVSTDKADGRISAQIWTAALFALVALWLLKRGNLLSFLRWRPDYIREALRFGVPLIPHVGGMFLLASVDRFVINSELGLAQTGIYMVAVQFATALALVFDAVNKAYVPWLFERLKRDQEGEKRQIVRFTYGWYALILCGAALAFILGPWMVTFVAGENYGRAGDVFGWLALGQVFGGMYLMVTNYIFFSKRTGLLSLVTIASGLINVALLFVLIGTFGLEGAAYSFCIAMAIRFLLTWVVAQKRHPMPWFNLRTQS